MRDEEFTLIGRNPVIEAFRAGKAIDRLFVQDGLHDGPISTILREAKKAGVKPEFVKKERLDEIAGQGASHQGVAAYIAAFMKRMRIRSFSSSMASRIHITSAR